VDSVHPDPDPEPEHCLNTEWRLPISGVPVHPIIMEKSVHHAPAERADTLPLFHLYRYMYAMILPTVFMFRIRIRIVLHS
jgi:hypothetical protein